MANSLLLLLNTFLLVSQGVALLYNRPTAAMRSDSRTLQMDIHCQRAPFAVFVEKTFPQKPGYGFTSYGSTLFLKSDEVVNSEQFLEHTDESGTIQKKENITLAFGEGSSIAFILSTGKPIGIEDLTLTRVDGTTITSSFDRNADGFPDARVTNDLDKHLAKSEIWYDGKWHEAIAQGNKYEKQLVGGKRVLFDMQSGAWMPASDADGGDDMDISGEPHSAE
jgi:hypothetical protein